MDVTAVEVKANIKAKQIKPFYIFAGEEWAVQKIFIDQMSKACGKPIKRIDSITDVYATLRNRSFLNTSYVYVARDDKEFMQNEKLQSNIEQILNDNVFILLCTTLDKRTKFYKTYKDSIVEFEQLKSEILMKYIQKEIPLNTKNCEKLMDICEHDYGRCLLEIDKMRNFLNGQDEYVDYDSIFNYLLKDGTIYKPPKDAIFDFVDAILDDDTSCFDLHRQCLEVGEATMVMLKVLYDNAKAVLQVQSCESSDISKATGLNGWQIKNAQKHKAVYTNRELINIMNLCFECQRGIVTGQMAEEFAMPYILCEVI